MTKTGESDQADKELQLFVVLVTLRVLEKSGAIEVYRKESLIGHTIRLVPQILLGLTLKKKCCLNMKESKRVAKAVLKDLVRKFEGQLKYLTMMEHPAAQDAIVQSFQCKIQSHCDRLAAGPYRQWCDYLGFLAALGVILAISVVIVVTTLFALL
ncbi:hypothetical protein F2P81_017335 [Scophthalmus maximus]|nr:hypothetical protein F2P81_017335 [Scophthalmus maximus]